MNKRANWTDLNPIIVDGVEMVESLKAAMYLGLHLVYFRQLCNNLNVEADSQLGRSKLYTKDTLDRVDEARGKVGWKPGKPRITSS